MHEPEASPRRRRGRATGVAALAIGAWTILAATAVAGPREADIAGDAQTATTVHQTTPPKSAKAIQGQSAAFFDAVGDNEAGLAPDIRSLVLSTSADETLTTVVGLDSNLLIDGDAVGTYVDTDGNAGTGSPIWEGADLAVLIVGQSGADTVGVLRWNGSAWTQVFLPSLVSFAAGDTDEVWAASLADLGIAPGATIRVRVGAIYVGLFDTYGDFFPQPSAPPVSFFVGSSVAPRPAATPPPAPVPAPGPGAPPIGAPALDPAPPAGGITAGTGARPLTLRTATARRSGARVRLRVGWTGGSRIVRWRAILATRVDARQRRLVVGGRAGSGTRTIARSVRVPTSWREARARVRVRIEVRNGARTIVRNRVVRLR